MQHKTKAVITALVTVLLFSVSGCGIQGEDPLNSRMDDKKVVGTNGLLIAIQSDNVQAAGYEATTLTMTVQFKNGFTYEYYGVPLEVWDSFVSAQPHPWSQVGYPRLVQAGVPYKRIR